MVASKSVAERLGTVLERVTQQSGRLPDAPDFGSWLLGRVGESQRRRRIRIQLILTTFVVVANLIGIGIATLVILLVFPVPSVFAQPVRWITFGVAPAYILTALVVGVFWATRRVINNVRWAIEERTPSRKDQVNTFFAPWRLTRVLLILWGAGTLLLSLWYGLEDVNYLPKVLLGISFPGIVVSACCYLFTEFALRPVAAQALEAGRPPRRLAEGVMGRTMVVWALGSGVPVLGILLAALITLTMQIVSPTQFAIAVMVLAVFALVFGFISMWILSWLTATPVRVVRTALSRVERGDLDTNLVVFDGTELGQLQRGFNAMVDGLRERERVRDLFGRHVGREVAAAAERQQIELGGEERHVAVLFVDIIGSTKIAADRSPVEVVELLNRFFAVIVEEVDSHQGLLNKFEGDASLVIFGAPIELDRPECNALSAARTIARRLADEVPEVKAGIGVSAGNVVAGNIGAYQRFEYTVIGDAVNEAARLSEEAKSRPKRVLASSVAVKAAGESEREHWTFDGEVVLRGRKEATRLAEPA